MTDRPNVIKKTVLGHAKFYLPIEYQLNHNKAKIIHHDRIFVIWMTCPYASESRSQCQKLQFAPDKIDNVFMSLVFIHYPPVIIPFLSCSCLERFFSTRIFFCESELTFVTLTSQYAFWAFLHTPFALISGRALSDVVISYCHETSHFTIKSMGYIEFLATRTV